MSCRCTRIEGRGCVCELVGWLDERDVAVGGESVCTIESFMGFAYPSASKVI